MQPCRSAVPGHLLPVEHQKQTFTRAGDQIRYGP